MEEYIHTASIPTESDSRSITFTDSIYFSSHTNIYNIKHGIFSIFTSVEGTINHFAINTHNIFICTEDRVYMNHGDTNVGSLRRTATAIDANENIFAIGVGNALEVWNVPKEYSFTLFKNRGKFTGHHRPIKIIKILNNNYILTASEDNTIRLCCVNEGKSKTILTLGSTPIDLHVIGESQGVATSSDGIITFFDLKIESNIFEKKRVIMDGTIISSCCKDNIMGLILKQTFSQAKKQDDEDHFHFKPAGKDMDILDEKSGGIDTEVIKPRFKKPEESYCMVMLRDGKEIYRIDVGRRIDSLRIRGDELAMCSGNFVGIFSILSEKFTFAIDLPKITGFTVTGESIAAVCADRKVRIYNNHVCRAVLSDSKGKGDVLDGIIRGNSCIVSYKSGYVSVFNIADLVCYRSFSITGGDGICNDFKYSTADDDGRILFVATDGLIFIIDIQRSKKIDEIKLDCPLSNMIYYREFLYYLNMKNELTKFNVFNSKSTTLQLETTAIGFCVGKNNIVVSTASELVFYDLDFNYLNTIGITLEGRHREEVFSKKKPVEFFDFNSSRIFCGGRTNTIRILENRTGSDHCTLYSNNVIQTLKASKNKNWENYKEKLGREKTTPFNKKNFIEVRKIVAGTLKFYVLTREGIQIFEKTKRSFNPIEFEVSQTPEFVNESLVRKNYMAALIASTQLGDYELISKVIKCTEDVKHCIEFVPRERTDIILRFISEIFKNDSTNIKALEFIKWIVFYHKIIQPGLLEMIKENTSGDSDDYESLKKACYLLKNIKI